MQFMWDSANIAHIDRHQITPEEAEQVVENNPLDIAVQLRSREERTVHLGETNAGRVLVVVITIRDGLLRVVTAHPADKSARKFYAQKKEEQHGEDT
jgi:uncharacterized DUF497 family protein